MSVVVACYKWVRDEDGIRIGNDASVDLSQAQEKISEYDRSAIQAAVTLAEASGAVPVSLTYGGATVEKSTKDALARGLEKAYYISSAAQEEADGRVTAQVLAKGVEAVGDVSAVVTAEGASDTYARQVGPRIGVELGWPVITSVLSFEVNGDTLTAVRKLDDTIQKVEVALPAVVSVLAEGFEPEAPGLRALMAAKKKPSEEIAVDSLGVDETPACRRTDLKGYVTARKNVMITEEDPTEATHKLVEALRKEGIIA